MSDAVRRWRGHRLTDVITALVTAFVVEIGLRTVTLPVLADRLSVPLAIQPQSDLHPVDLRAIAETVPILSALEQRRLTTVLAVMRRWPWGSSCLRIALVAGRALRHRRPRLSIGVRRDGGVVSAHAWLLVDGRALDPEAGNYIPLSRGARG